MPAINKSITINASPEKVWNLMLSPDTYKQWCEPFSPGSYYEGSMTKDSQIIFKSGEEEGGLVSVVEEYSEPQKISFKFLGFEDEEGEVLEVEGWTNQREIYEFTDLGNSTLLEISAFMDDENYDTMLDAWDKALAKLKDMCES